MIEELEKEKWDLIDRKNSPNQKSGITAILDERLEEIYALQSAEMRKRQCGFDDDWDMVVCITDKKGEEWCAKFFPKEQITIESFENNILKFEANEPSMWAGRYEVQNPLFYSNSTLLSVMAARPKYLIDENVIYSTKYTTFENKRKIWAEDYSYVDWEDFRDRYFQCDRCGGWEKGVCICYAR